LESRKVQKVGSSTLAVSLPQKWVRAVNLKQGDLVFFDIEKDGTLKVSKADRRSVKASSVFVINADLCKVPNMLQKVIFGSYVLGHENTKIVSSKRLNRVQIDEIRSAIRQLMGVGIMEETINDVILQCSIDITKFPIDVLIKRLYIIASTMHKEAFEALLKSDVKIAEDAISRMSEANNIYWIIVRLILSAQNNPTIQEEIGIENPREIIWYRMVAQYLRLIANWSSKIAEKVIAFEKSKVLLGELLLEEICEINDETFGLCHKAMNGLISSNVELANNAIETYNKIQEREEKIQEKICTHAYLRDKSFSVSKYFHGKGPLEPCAICQLSFIIWSIRRIAELGSEIAEVAIWKAISKPTKLCKEVKLEKPSFINLPL